jgi:hypothetical protein
VKSIHVARAHRQHQLFVGYGTSVITMIALVLNTLVVPAGFIALAFTNGWPGWPVLLFSATIGIFLALVSDIMTLTSAARLRKALEEKKIIQKQFAEISPRERTQAIKEMKQEQESALTPRYWINGLLIIFFSFSSGSAGDIFWQRFLNGKMETWEVWSGSIIFSLIISWCMISSEIYRRDNEELIMESIKDANFTSIAAQQDANDSASLIMNKRYETKIKQIAEDSPIVDGAIEASTEDIYDRLLMGGQGRLQLRMRQDRDSREYAERQEAERTRVQLKLIQGGVSSQPQLTDFERVRGFMGTNPTCINKDIEAAFPDMPTKTLRTYASRVRQERVVNERQP